MSTLTPLGAYLDQLRRNPLVVIPPGGPQAEQAITGSERLLNAVEAALAVHQPRRFVVAGQVCRDHRTHRDFSITEPEAQAVRDCPSCTANVYLQCAGCQHPCPCPTVAGITAELVGEGKPDGT